MAYLDEIEAALKAHPELANYRLSLTERRGVAVGIKDNQVGNVYAPFTFSSSTSGGFLVQWRDGRLSRGNVDGSTLEMIDHVLATAREAAYDDPDAAIFLGPQRITPVPLASDASRALIDERPGDLLEIVALLQAEAARLGAKTLSGSAGASAGRRWVRSSRGLDLVEESTSFGYSYYFDGIIGDGFSSRAPEALEQISAQIARTGVFFEALRRPGPTGLSKTMPIILHPNVARSLIDYFVLGNLQGSAVFHGQAAFSRADFDQGRRVLREDLTLTVDPLTPLGPGSYWFTGEGVPAAPTTYIARGRLEQPILDLKYANKMGLPPTTPPSNEYSIHLISQGAMPAWETLLPQVDEAVLILSILGLHTQDRTSGSFSLTGPQALYIRNGVVEGQSKATFSGNFFEALRSPELQLVGFEGQHSCGLQFLAQVTLEEPPPVEETGDRV